MSATQQADVPGAGAAAGVLRRVAATLIDVVLVPVTSVLLMLVSGLMESPEAYVGAQPIFRALLLGVAGYLLVNGWLLATRAQTVGKAITGLVIVSAVDGAKAPLWRLVCIRALFFPLLYLPLLVGALGAFAALPLLDLAFALRTDRRCLHDLAAGTRVLRRLPAPLAAPA